MRITGRRQPHPTANLVVEAIVLMKTEEYTSQPQCYTCRCRAGCMAVQLLYLVSWFTQAVSPLCWHDDAGDESSANKPQPPLALTMPGWLMDREMAPEAVGMGWTAQGNELLEQRRTAGAKTGGAHVANLGLRGGVVRPAGYRFASTVVAARRPAEPSIKPPPLGRMPLKTLIRSFLLTSLMGKRWLLRPSLAALNFICRSKSGFFNPDRNWALNKILRWVIYDQFAAGTNAAQVARKSLELKRMGFQGIILGYAKEFVLEDPSDSSHAKHEQGYSAAQYHVIDKWKEEHWRLFE
ncbi:hypothetical protein ACCO45_002819 [Purpureocillium lilacinum]|uniref:Uncharacterized protein n=1 Tax=Purpureocillium lilacinum TaxID=33203 RepID=A0ACC4DYG5_PURLI